MQCVYAGVLVHMCDEKWARGWLSWLQAFTTVRL